MAISFRASTGPTGSVAATLTLTKPAGTVSTDIMIAVIKDDTNGGITPPSGWTLVVSKNDGLFGTSYIYWSLGSNTSFAWSVAASGTNGAIGVVVSYIGCDTTTPIGASASSSTVGTASPFTWNAPSVTSTIDNSWRVAGFGYCDQSGGASPAFTESITQRISGDLLDAAGGIRVGLSVGDVNITPAGASGTSSCTATGGNPAGGTQQAMAFVLQPLAATPSDEGGGFYFLPSRPRPTMRLG